MLGQPFCWLFDTTSPKPMSNMRLIKTHQKIHQLSLQQQLHQKHRGRERKVGVERYSGKPLQQRGGTCHRLLLNMIFWQGTSDARLASEQPAPAVVASRAPWRTRAVLAARNECSSAGISGFHTGWLLQKMSQTAPLRLRIFKAWMVMKRVKIPFWSCQWHERHHLVLKSSSRWFLYRICKASDHENADSSTAPSLLCMPKAKTSLLRKPCPTTAPKTICWSNHCKIRVNGTFHYS